MKEEDTLSIIQYRMERAIETLEDAQFLLANHRSPESVVNRAYYAMFYASLALLFTVNQHSSKHGGVIALIDKHFVKTGDLPKEMGKFLHKAFDMRQSADYEKDVDLTMEDAHLIVGYAERFVTTAREKLIKDGLI